MDEILSRGEADALLGIVDEVSSGGISDDMSLEAADVLADARTVASRPTAVALDLAGPPQLRPAAHAVLRRVATRWARAVREPLAELVRADVEVHCTEMTPASALRALKDIPRPTWLHLVSWTPLDGHCLLVLDPSLALAVVDRLLGGGKGGDQAEADPEPPPPRELSAIEEKIASRLSDRLLDGLGAALQDVVPGLRLRSVHREPEPAAATTVFAPGEGLVSLTLAIAGALSGTVRALLPLGQLAEQILRSQTPSQAGSLASDPREGTVQEHLDTLCLEVSAVLSELELTVQELLSLRPNDIVTLGPRESTRARVLVEGMHKFDGRLGTRCGRLVVRVTAHDGRGDRRDDAPRGLRIKVVGDRAASADPAQAA